MGIAEVGLHLELCVEPVVEGELGSIVEGHAFAQSRRQGFEPLAEAADDRRGVLGRLGGEKQDAGLSLVGEEDVLAAFREGHEVGLPVSGDAAAGDGERPFVDGSKRSFDAVLEGLDGRAAFAAAPAAPGLGARQVVAPGAVVAAAQLGVDEAVDALMAGDAAASLAVEPGGGLLGRPALLKAGEHLPAQLRIAIEPCASPAALVGLALGLGGLVAHVAVGVALQLARDRRRRAAKRLSDLMA